MGVDLRRLGPRSSSYYFDKVRAPSQQNAPRRQMTVEIFISQVTGSGFDIDEQEYDNQVGAALRWGLERIRADIEEHGPKDQSGFTWEDYPSTHEDEESIVRSISDVEISVGNFGIEATMGIESPHAAEVEFGTLAMGEDRSGMKQIFPVYAEALVIPIALIRNHIRPFMGELDPDRIVQIGNEEYLFSASAWIPGQRPQKYVRNAINRYRGAIREHLRAVLRRALRMRDAHFDVNVSVRVS